MARSPSAQRRSWRRAGDTGGRVNAAAVGLIVGWPRAAWAVVAAGACDTVLIVAGAAGLSRVPPLAGTGFPAASPLCTRPSPGWARILGRRSALIAAIWYG